MLLSLCMCIACLEAVWCLFCERREREEREERGRREMKRERSSSIPSEREEREREERGWREREREREREEMSRRRERESSLFWKSCLKRRREKRRRKYMWLISVLMYMSLYCMLFISVEEEKWNVSLCGFCCLHGVLYGVKHVCCGEAGRSDMPGYVCFCLLCTLFVAV